MLTPPLPPTLNPGPETTEVALRDTLGACLAAVAEHTKDYIWQKEPFTLSVVPAAATGTQCAPLSLRLPCAVTGATSIQLYFTRLYLPASPPSATAEPAHLRGSSAYGDAVEDEWFIVFLLRELTRLLPVSARAWDADGEFLLIEAAYHLPKWCGVAVPPWCTPVAAVHLSVFPLAQKQTPALASESCPSHFHHCPQGEPPRQDGEPGVPQGRAGAPRSADGGAVVGPSRDARCGLRRRCAAPPRATAPGLTDLICLLRMPFPRVRCALE